MRQLIRGIFILFAATVVLATSASGARKVATIKAASGAIETGVGFVKLPSDADDATQLERIHAAGAKYVQLRVYWASVAPAGSTQPTGFQPTDPADPNYNWNGYDKQIRAVVAAGLKPIVAITSAPLWAEGSSRGSTNSGAYKPSPSALASFMTAVARRYSGSFEDLPRVQYWAVWNEPNLNTFMAPQMVKGKAFSPGWYRSMLNAAADALHAVNSSNVVIGGETAPFGTTLTRKATMPVVFMEKVLCVAEKKVRNRRTRKVSIVYKSACKTKTKFDVWAHHPYTQGGPTIKAKLHGNASLGDMGAMRAVLNTAIKANHVRSSKRVRLWVTEFSWDSKPPDRKGVPIALETRWVSQMLYQMWSSGVSFVNWFILRDEPFVHSRVSWQSGLYYAGSSISSDRAKPLLRAFRFPFVALPHTSKGKTTVMLWGRTPTSTAGKVTIERKSGGKWKRVKTLNANSYGVFKGSIAKPAKTVYLRARLSSGKDQSAQFSLIAPKKPWTGCVWGTCPS
jgi:hypothetical protein